MKETPSDSTSNEEKRNYFRLDSDIIFDFKTIESQAANNTAPSDNIEDGQQLHLMSELRNIDQSLQAGLSSLANKHRELSDFLLKLNKKIDLVAQSLLLEQHPSDKATSRVNISEGGIAFNCERALYKGNYLVIRLIFLPSFIPVVVFGKVNRCDFDGETYQIAASFYKLQEAARKTLSQQILQAQARARKQPQ